MKLKQSIQHYDIDLNFQVTIPGVSKLSKVAREIDKHIGDGSAVELTAPRKLLDEGMEAILAGNVGRLSSKTLRLFCTAGLPDLERLRDPLAGLNTLLDEVSIRARSSFVKALFLGYLLSADLESAWVNVLRLYLRKQQDLLSPRWQQRINQYGLLDKDLGNQFGKLFFNHDDSFFTSLASAGISGLLLTSGIGKRVFMSVTRQLGLSDWPHKADALDIFNRLKRYAFQDEKLIFSASNNQREICFALLEPCLNGDPGNHVLIEIRNLLVGNYSDPRINAGRWASVEESHVQVLRRWLTKQSMGLLIEVINRTADDNHWDVRNDFWSFYLNNDFVDEAWVVFGPDALGHAKSLVRNNREFTVSSFGTFKAGWGGFQSNQSVLLMRIDDVIVAEWTHDGKVRLWDRRSPSSPAFYKNTYLPEQLRGAGVRYSASEEHPHDRPGHWMRKVDQFIRERTGIKHPMNVKSGTERDANIQRTRNQSMISGRGETGFSGKSDDKKKSSSESGIYTPRTYSYGEHQCASCGLIKSPDKFFQSSKRPGELTKYCKSCLEKQ